MGALLAGLWEKNARIVDERVAAVAAGLDQLVRGEEAEPIAAAALDAAHKLAGSLGMYGFHDGSTLANRIERLLRREGDDDPAALQEQLSVLAHQLAKGPPTGQS